MTLPSSVSMRPPRTSGCSRTIPTWIVHSFPRGPGVESKAESAGWLGLRRLLHEPYPDRINLGAVPDPGRNPTADDRLKFDAGDPKKRGFACRRLYVGTVSDGPGVQEDRQSGILSCASAWGRGPSTALPAAVFASKTCRRLPRSVVNHDGRRRKSS
jgi:hypothetical protein